MQITALLDIWQRKQERKTMAEGTRYYADGAEMTKQLGELPVKEEKNDPWYAISSYVGMELDKNEFLTADEYCALMTALHCD